MVPAFGGQPLAPHLKNYNFCLNTTQIVQATYLIFRSRIPLYIHTYTHRLLEMWRGGTYLQWVSGRVSTKYTPLINSSCSIVIEFKPT